MSCTLDGGWVLLEKLLDHFAPSSDFIAVRCFLTFLVSTSSSSSSSSSSSKSSSSSESSLSSSSSSSSSKPSYQGSLDAWEHQTYLQEVVFSIHNQKMRAILWCLVRREYGQSLGWAKWHRLCHSKHRTMASIVTSFRDQFFDMRALPSGKSVCA